jgi:hypothetical protein
MKRKSGLWLMTVFLLFFLQNAKAQLIPYNGKELYWNGPNVAWNNYGWDFGDNPQGWGGGNGYNSTWWENHFTQLESYGANSARVWVHCKGENNPLFDASNNCTGLNANFLNNLGDMLNRAKNHNIMVLLCLWDFHITDYASRDQVITDTAKTRLYIDNALIPLVKHFKRQCNLIGYEIINEPEWICSGIPDAGNFSGGTVTVQQMQRFVAVCTEAVHAYSAKYATVGSASLKWSSNAGIAKGNFWEDGRLYNSNKSSKVYLDFYQIHYYDWMAYGYSPYSQPASIWQFEKPVLIGESGNTGYYNYQQQFNLGYSNGFAGTMIWASSATTGGAATWAQFNNQMKTFRDNNSTKVDFDCDALPIQLVDFSIRDSMDVIKIRWSTQNEINHDHFFVERTDGVSTTDLLIVTLDSTDVQNVKYYSLNDTLASAGIYKYRLVQVDLSFSEHPFLWHLVGVQTELYTSVDQLSSPGFVLHRILESGNYTLQLMDLQGRVVVKKTASAENYKMLIKESYHGTGIYILELSNGQEIFYEKILLD